MRAWEARALPLGDTRARPNASTTPAINARNHPIHSKRKARSRWTAPLPPPGQTASTPPSSATLNGWFDTAHQPRDFRRTAPMPLNSLAVPSGWRPTAQQPMVPADGASSPRGSQRTAPSLSLAVPVASIYATSVLHPVAAWPNSALLAARKTACDAFCGGLTMAINLRHVFSRRPLTEITPLSGNISLPCIQNELVLARFARCVSK